MLTGYAKNVTVFIPRIQLIPSDYQSDLKRLQFPAELHFAMIINNAHGRLLKELGTELKEEYFFTWIVISALLKS
jgi:hypothetical protein